MGKILVLTASPRKNGNSNTMARAFAERAGQLGHEVCLQDVTALKIGSCRACHGCAAKKGCVVQDDFQGVAEKLLAADGIVIAAPVYWYTFPGWIKPLIDRFYALYEGGTDFTGKKTALLTCCEDTDETTFYGIQFAFEKTMGLMGAEIVGEVMVANVCAAGDIDKTDGAQRAAALAERF